MKLSLALIVLVITGIHALAAEPALSVGFSDVDITPTLGKKPVLMAGFGHNRIATKIHDPLMARAVVLSDGTNKIALVAVDLVGFFLPNVETVRTKLSGFQYVMISATHNHEGPDTLGLWGASPFQNGIDPEYLKLVEEKCAKAVTQADAFGAIGLKRLPGFATVFSPERSNEREMGAPNLSADVEKPDFQKPDSVIGQTLYIS